MEKSMSLAEFHDVRFPLDVARGARGGPRRLTDVVTLASGREQRNQRWARSRRRYDAGYGVKSLADLSAVVAFFEARRGRLIGFRWRDPLDFRSSAAASPTALDQPIGTGDGANRVFQLAKSYGGPPNPYVRAITRPAAGSVLIAVAGATLAANLYTVDHATGLVTLTTAPASGAAVTAGFLFDVAVRFDTDELDVELSAFNAGEIPRIPIIEILD
jgi:uncharacterized protein (TIGR02217 family)